jgi:hypothetical protein
VTPRLRALEVRGRLGFRARLVCHGDHGPRARHDPCRSRHDHLDDTARSGRRGCRVRRRRPCGRGNGGRHMGRRRGWVRSECRSARGRIRRRRRCAGSRGTEECQSRCQRCGDAHTRMHPLRVGHRDLPPFALLPAFKRKPGNDDVQEARGDRRGGPLYTHAPSDQVVCSTPWVDDAPLPARPSEVLPFVCAS